ncbi:MAG: pyridoxamine 5'-phosphate oxidase family protein [Sphaerochaetaceae bacterium]
MRRSKREITDSSEISLFLRHEKVLHLGFQDALGMCIFPLNYGAIQEGGKWYLVFHGAIAGRKAEFFTEPRQVCFEIEGEGQLLTGPVACSYSYAYTSVMGNGMVSAAPEEKKEHYLAVLMKQLTGKENFAYDKTILGQTKLFLLCVESLTCKRRER